MIFIKKSQTADTTDKSKIKKDTLLASSYSHIDDVKHACEFISNKILEQSKNHDFTKINYIDEFYDDFISDFKGKSHWFKKRHIVEERHHLMDNVPDDVNLIDVVEMVCDCTMAGLARTGFVYELKIPTDVLQKAINNTVELLIANTKIEDTENIMENLSVDDIL